MPSRLAALLSERPRIAGCEPWPRHEVTADGWTAIGEALGAGAGDLVALWAEPGAVHLALRSTDLKMPAVVSVAVDCNGFPSIGRHHPPAEWLERAIRDLYGFEPLGAPDRRHWLDHGAWGVHAPLGPGTPAALRDAADYTFLDVQGEGIHQIPVGPVHAGIIEPGHFRFTANGETVVRLEERLGYVHKGIDGLLADVELSRAQRVVARVSGDATVAYSLAFARAVEAALGVAAPQRATVLRGIVAELERLANHLGDIGAICNDAAFALIHAHCGIFRERVLAAAAAAFGHRLMMDYVVPGGVAHDIAADGPRAILAMLEEVLPRFAEIVRLYDETPSLQDRTCRTGNVGADLVMRFAAGGHVGRAAGRSFDTRRDLAYPPYAGLAFTVPVLAAGDVDARVWVRIREIEASALMLRGWLAALPDGPVATAPPVYSEPREGIAMTEAFRGDVFVWLRIAAGRISRAHARDPSWFQWPLLEAAIKGNIVADFPLCNKSFNCSYSGHDL
ncbi:MAG TPA: NADH-quinone oxidoreductase subunit C [Xanthobacteraceae bacterium]|nr:NADH-quinone oxidoreductase subunit C [Xanthobacteraceae bacterium]